MQVIELKEHCSIIQIKTCILMCFVNKYARHKMNWNAFNKHVNNKNTGCYEQYSTFQINVCPRKHSIQQYELRCKQLPQNVVKIIQTQLYVCLFHNTNYATKFEPQNCCYHNTWLAWWHNG